jgi:predicted adenylyl cyclase CyaB
VARNIEIKARVADLARLRATAASLAPTPSMVLAQTDTFFVVPRGRLKLRELGDGAAELIFYERADHVGPKESSYVRYTCADPKGLAALLGGALGIRGVVEKRREVFLIGRTRIHLDEVRGLGIFMEIEVVLGDGDAAAEGEREARVLLAAFDIPQSALVAPAYIDLLEEGCGGA